MSRTAVDDTELRRFTDDLRELRLRAGKPGYRQLTERTRYGRTVLSEALNGAKLPTWDVTRALVVTLGGDERAWQERWARLAARPRPAPADAGTRDSARSGTTAPPADGDSARAETDDVPLAVRTLPGMPNFPEAAERRRPSRRVVVAAVATVAVVAAVVVALLAGRSDPPAAPDTRPGARSAAAETCFEVAASDVRVFAEPQGRTVAGSWRTGTRFWGVRDASVEDRLRVPLRDGTPGWVTADERFVRPATACTP